MQLRAAEGPLEISTVGLGGVRAHGFRCIVGRKVAPLLSVEPSIKWQ